MKVAGMKVRISKRLSCRAKKDTPVVCVLGASRALSDSMSTIPKEIVEQR